MRPLSMCDRSLGMGWLGFHLEAVGLIYPEAYENLLLARQSLPVLCPHQFYMILPMTMLRKNYLC